MAVSSGLGQAHKPDQASLFRRCAIDPARTATRLGRTLCVRVQLGGLGTHGVSWRASLQHTPQSRQPNAVFEGTVWVHLPPTTPCVHAEPRPLHKALHVTQQQVHLPQPWSDLQTEGASLPAEPVAVARAGAAPVVLLSVVAEARLVSAGAWQLGWSGVGWRRRRCGCCCCCGCSRSCREHCRHCCLQVNIFWPLLNLVPVPPLALQRRGCARTSPLLKRLVGPAMPRLGTIQITELVRGISWHNVNLQANEPASSFSVRWNMATPAIVSRAPPAMVGTNKNTLMPAFRMRVWRS